MTYRWSKWPYIVICEYASTWEAAKLEVAMTITVKKGSNKGQRRELCVVCGYEIVIRKQIGKCKGHSFQLYIYLWAQAATIPISSNILHPDINVYQEVYLYGYESHIPYRLPLTFTPQCKTKNESEKNSKK